MWITWPFFPKNLKPRSLTPRWPLTPKKGHCIHILWCIFVKVRHNDPWVESHMWPQQTWGQRSSWGQRSLTPRWPLTPSLLRSHVWFYPRIIVSNFDENTSKYVDTVTLFSKTWTKGHWPLDDIWPQDCWGHIMWLYPRTIVAKWKYIKVCGYSDPFFKNLNQRSLTPRWHLTPRLLRSHYVTLPKDHCGQVEIHQSMWIQWSILQNYHILHTYILRTHYICIQNEWWHSLLLNSI